MHHSQSTNSRLVVALVAMGCLAAGRAGQGSIIESHQSSSSQSNFDLQISSTDLINNGQNSLASAAVTAGAVNGGSLDGSHDGAASNGESDISKDLFFGNSNYPGGSAPITLTFNLNTEAGTGGSATGYDLTGTNLFYGWSSNPPFSVQTWTMKIETITHPSTFTALWSESYNPALAGPGNSSLVKLTDSSLVLSNGSVVATGVTAVQFVLTPPNADGNVVREIDVLGAATVATVPEPGSFVLLSLGLVGLGFSRRWRRHAPA